MIVSCSLDKRVMVVGVIRDVAPLNILVWLMPEEVRHEYLN